MSQCRQPTHAVRNPSLGTDPSYSTCSIYFSRIARREKNPASVLYSVSRGYSCYIAAYCTVVVVRSSHTSVFITIIINYIEHTNTIGVVYTHSTVTFIVPAVDHSMCVDIWSGLYISKLIGNGPASRVQDLQYLHFEHLTIIPYQLARLTGTQFESCTTVSSNWWYLYMWLHCKNKRVVFIHFGLPQ